MATKKVKLSDDQNKKISEVKELIKGQENLLLLPQNFGIAEQTWIALQITEYKNQIKAIKKGLF